MLAIKPSMASPYRESEGRVRAVRAYEAELAEHALQETTRTWILVGALAACLMLLVWAAAAGGVE